MTVEDFFKKLSFGEFSGLSLGMEGAGDIEHKAQPRIISFMNDGLLALYNRFVLSERELLIEMMEGVTSYHLISQFAETNCEECNDNPRYIRDGADPFEDDLLRVLDVRDVDGGSYPLNDAADPNSLFTPRVNMLQVPKPYPGQVLSVIYQARHKNIEYGIRGQTFYVPPVLERALTAFVAGKVFSAMNGQEPTLKGQEYMAEFEKVCAEVTDRDSVNNTQSNSTHKFDMRGFK